MGIKDYFAFTRGEKRGAVVLLLIITLLIVGNFLIDYLKINQRTDFSEFENAINQFEKNKLAEKQLSISSEINLFEFNPNSISDEEWKKLGFKDWQIKTINKYKAKGGSWKTKSDVSKIYGVSPEDFQLLEPYILLPEEIQKTTITSNTKNYDQKVNVNTADAKELTNLKGINSEKYAAIIIKYRTSLGGFIKKEQLKEVWNLSEETYNGFENQLDLGKQSPIQLNINIASSDELKQHPYIDWKTANAIEKYRKANGKFKTVNDVKKIHLISEEIYHKIAPYLKIQ